MARKQAAEQTCRNRSTGGSTAAQDPNYLVISDLTPLNEVLKIFKLAYSHLMIAASFTDAATGRVLTPDEMSRWAADDPNGPRPQPFRSTFTGVITLEDVIEEVIDYEIVDEHDLYKSNDTKAINDRVRCACACSPPPAHVLPLLYHDASLRLMRPCQGQAINALNGVFCKHLRQHCVRRSAAKAINGARRHPSSGVCMRSAIGDSRVQATICPACVSATGDGGAGCAAGHCQVPDAVRTQGARAEPADATRGERDHGISHQPRPPLFHL